MPGVEEARGTPGRLRFPGRQGPGAGQVVLALGDRPAHRAHVLHAARRVQGRGAALVGVQRRGLLRGRLGVAADRDVRVMIGHPGTQRDQVILRGRLGVLEFLLPAPADGPPDEEAAEDGQQDDDARDDQDGGQRARRPAGRAASRAGGRARGGLLLHVFHELRQGGENVAVRLMLLDHLGGDGRGAMAGQHPLVVGAEVPEPAVQVAHRELGVPAEIADDLAHRAVVARRPGRGGDHPDGLGADLAGQLSFLARGDQRPGAAAHADVLLGQALGERAGAGRGRKQPEPREQQGGETKQPLHTPDLLPQCAPGKH